MNMTTRKMNVKAFIEAQGFKYTQELRDKVLKAVGKPDSNAQLVVTEQMEPKALKALGVNAPGSKPPKAASRKTPAPKPADQPHPAHLAYRQWEDTLEFPYKGFLELATWPTRDRQDRIIKYRCPDGGEREMKLSDYSVRAARAGGRGMGYFLLSPELEKQAVLLIAEFPGAPTVESTCSATGLPLFISAGELYAHFRDIAEAIMTSRVEPEGVSFRTQRPEANDWLKFMERFDSATRQLEADLARLRASDEVRTQARKDHEKEWLAKANKHLTWLNKARHTPGSIIKEMRQQFRGKLTTIDKKEGEA